MASQLSVWEGKVQPMTGFLRQRPSQSKCVFHHHRTTRDIPALVACQGLPSWHCACPCGCQCHNTMPCPWQLNAAVLELACRAC